MLSSVPALPIPWNACPCAYHAGNGVTTRIPAEQLRILLTSAVGAQSNRPWMACATIRANAELLRCKFGADPSDATEACTEIAIQQGRPSVDADRQACEAVALGTRDTAASCASARRSCSSDADCGGDEGSCVTAVTGCTTTPDPACALVGTDQADCEAAGSCTWANRDGEWGCAVTDQDAACEAAATGKDACEAAGAAGLWRLRPARAARGAQRRSRR